MRKLTSILAIAATFAALAAPAQAGFRVYPGFLDPYAKVEMVHDKGLVMEIVVRCRRKADGQISPGILSYSKVERLYCSSKGRCGRSPLAAARHTCS